VFFSAASGRPGRGVGDHLEAGSPKELFRGPYFLRDGSLGRLYDVGPDGRFLLLKRDTSVSPHLIIVQNWLAELARPVP
jgi:hypothetical protein